MICHKLLVADNNGGYVEAYCEKRNGILEDFVSSDLLKPLRSFLFVCGAPIEEINGKNQGAGESSTLPTIRVHNYEYKVFVIDTLHELLRNEEFLLAWENDDSIKEAIQCNLSAALEEGDLNAYPRACQKYLNAVRNLSVILPPFRAVVFLPGKYFKCFERHQSKLVSTGALVIDAGGPEMASMQLGTETLKFNHTQLTRIASALDEGSPDEAKIIRNYIDEQLVLEPIYEQKYTAELGFNSAESRKNGYGMPKLDRGDKR